MRKTLLFVMMLASSMAWGEQLTPEQALSRFKNSNSSAAKARGLNSSLKLAYTAEKEGLNAFYVYNSGTDGGYVILSADDCAPALLGYTDSGTFDMANIPSNMKAWLDGYAQQIAAASKAKATNLNVSGFTADAISPLLTTKWNQKEPYNDLCPLLDGKRAVTGCVATAMAQVMKYHKWPAQATGKINYTFEYGTNQKYTVDDDLSKYTFDWENMADIYDGKTTEAQNKAVAELMLACGESVRMVYATDESGAVGENCTPAFLNNFNYDKGAYIAYRTCYTCEEWDSLVYNELKNKRPVLFEGTHSGEGDGHAFVCDGYDGAGRFHINWGWAGKSDGYFLLTVLDPDSHGIGGNPGSNYSLDSNAFFGVMPPAEGAESKVKVNWYANSFVINDIATAYYTEKESFGRSDKFAVCPDGGDSKFTCLTVEPMTMTGGLLIYNPGGDSTFVACEEGAGKYSYIEGISSFTIDCSKLPEGGSFLVKPAVMGEDSTVTPIKFSLYGNLVIGMSVTKDSVYLTKSIENMSSLECEIADDVDAVILNSYNQFGISITNKGGAEYNSFIYGSVSAYDENNNLIEVAKAKANLIVVPAYSTVNVDYNEVFNPNTTVNLSDYNKFYLAVKDEIDNIISDTISLPNLADAKNLTIQKFSANAAADGHVAWDDLTLNVELTGGLPNHYITVLVYFLDLYTEVIKTNFKMNLNFDSEGKYKGDWKLSSIMNEKLPDGTYYVILRYVDKTDVDFAEGLYAPGFVLDSTATGISEVSTDGVETKIYSIDGRYVGTSKDALAPGMYISGGKKFIMNNK